MKKNIYSFFCFLVFPAISPLPQWLGLALILGLSGPALARPDADAAKKINEANRISFSHFRPQVAGEQVISFTLINADTNEPIQFLTNADTLNLTALPTRNLNIRANTGPGPVGSVVFALTGQQSWHQQESRRPFALFGGEQNNYNPWTPAVGEYTLKATPYAAAEGAGTPGQALTVAFTVTDAATVNQLPKANAGPDKTLTAPASSVTLAGAGTDPDGSISGYTWQQVAGPNTARFSSATVAAPTVSGLVVGSYTFSLTVKDNQGARSAASLVAVTVKPAANGAKPIIVQAPLGQVIITDRDFAFSAGQYRAADKEDALTYTATRVDNSSLPAWLQFNASNLTFSGTAPATAGTMSVKVTARDPAQAAVSVTFTITNVVPAAPVVTGEKKKWHNLTLTFNGPHTRESSAQNPFLDYRLNVTFRQGSRQLVVPGYYAADGDAAETGAAAGNKWRVHFVPDATGTWTYHVSFRTGRHVATSPAADAGNPVYLDGFTGSLSIGATNKTGADLRAKGRLQYQNRRYLQFAETKEYFLKGGAGSPENFLAYQGFDSTYAAGATDHTKTYAPHFRDWKTGDPTWKNGLGKGIIGALNYLASKGMNSVYFLTMNVNGDGQDVWPWTTPTQRLRYDVSKLAQWEIVFAHLDKLGLLLHVITQEQENDQLLDEGQLGVERKLYYRELVARFGHHLAITWSLGEENTNTDTQRKAFADYLKQLDPYNSPVDVHTFPNQKELVYTPLLGHPTIDGASLQISNSDDVHQQTLTWINNAKNSGKNWVVNLDEIGLANAGVLPDAQDYNHDRIREEALWGNLMAGGGGVAWYFGYSYANSDLTAQDWRSRDHMWELTDHALTFFQNYLPYWQMQNANGLTTATTDYCLAAPGTAYAIYLPNGGTTALNLGTSNATYQVKWYNPRTGGALQNGSLGQITGPGSVSIGRPPVNDGQDWVCLVTAELAGTSNPAALANVPADATHLAVYPNPMQNQLTVKANLAAALPLEIALLNATGKQIYATTSARAKTHVQPLNTASLKPGLYFIRIKYGNTSVVRQLVKE